MKKIIFLLVFAFLAFAQELKVTSGYFHYDMQKKISLFKGDVKVVKGKDKIFADEMTVYFNDKKKPVKFIAQGNVRFVIALDQHSTYKGTANKLIYQLNNGNIILLGNAKIVKLETKESIKGDKIILNRITKNAEVIGGKKPVEIILKVNE